MVLKKIIEKIYAERPNVDIYHYTSVEGLMGIVESKTLWASDIRYLNDAQELGDFSSFLKHEVESRLNTEDEEFHILLS